MRVILCCMLLIISTVHLCNAAQLNKRREVARATEAPRPDPEGPEGPDGPNGPDGPGDCLPVVLSKMVSTFLVTDANLIRSAAPEDARLAIIARGRAIKKLLDGIIDYMGPPGPDHLEPGLYRRDMLKDLLDGVNVDDLVKEVDRILNSFSNIWQQIQVLHPDGSLTEKVRSARSILETSFEHVTIEDVIYTYQYFLNHPMELLTTLHHLSHHLENRVTGALVHFTAEDVQEFGAHLFERVANFAEKMAHQFCKI